MIRIAMLLSAVLVSSLMAGPPKGKPVEPTSDEAKSLAAIKGKIKGKIAWSTSRDGNHHIYIMDADGGNQTQLTKGPKTDWFSRISPDGKQVIFTRSKMDWTTEPQAENPNLWDTWIINIDGTGEKLLIPNSDWATWRPDGNMIVFSRADEVYTFDMAANKETKILDSKTDGFEKAATLQNPHLSLDGNYMAITLRGKMRETGIWNMLKKSWFRSGEGCQINWFPSGDRVVRVNPTGNGGSMIYSFKVKEGRPEKENMSADDQSFMDFPGRRSHEYFPQISPDGKWMVWGITQTGHDHDIADYEMYIWEIGTKPETSGTAYISFRQ